MATGEPWVKETRFGNWFQTTDVWSRYVVAEAVDELARLFSRHRHAVPARPRILDAGCGAGIAFPLVADRFAAGEIVAVDIDTEMVLTSAGPASRAPCPVDVRLDNIEKLGLPDQSFDLVFCHQTLHHTSDQDAALREFHRVLRPGGFLLLAESCRRFTHSIPVRLLFRHPMQVQRTADEYLELIERAGFCHAPEQESTPQPFWSQPDFGLRDWMGLPRGSQEATQLCAIAERR